MILSEILPVIKCPIALQIDDDCKNFPGSQSIPLSLHRFVVEAIGPSENGVIVQLRANTDSRQLEQYGYSFEDGV